MQTYLVAVVVDVAVVVVVPVVSEDVLQIIQYQEEKRLRKNSKISDELRHETNERATQIPI